MEPFPLELRDRIARARRLGDESRPYPPPGFKSVGDLLQNRSSSSPDSEWLVFYDDGHREPARFSYGEFFKLVCRTANLLLDTGIGRGHRIATVAYNHVDTVIQYFAAWLIGAVVVPINVGEDDKRIGFILKNSECRCAFVREEYFSRIRGILASEGRRVSIIRTGGGVRSSGTPDFHDEIRRRSDTLQETVPVSPEDEALIVYTSGTTGQPKGVILTHSNLVTDAEAIAAWHRMSQGETMMCVLPVHHVNGIIVTLMTPLSYGGRIVLNRKFHTAEFFRTGRDCPA